MPKKILTLVIVLLLLSLFSVYASAHSGKTDSQGGHYDHQNGEYHYHHGYPAHSHTNGVCPYNFDDKAASSNSGSNSSQNNTKTLSKDTNISLGKIFSLLIESVFIFFALGIILIIACEFLSVNIPDKYSIVITILVGIASILLAHITDFFF